MSLGTKNKRTSNFKKLQAGLPPQIQRAATAAFKAFVANPHNPALGLHELDDDRRGRHRLGSHSVTVTYRYRAIFVVDGDINVWYWIGSHEDYNSFAGK